MLRSRGCGKKARRRPARVECENAPPGAQRANAKQGAKCEASEGRSFAGASGLWGFPERVQYNLIWLIPRGHRFPEARVLLLHEAIIIGDGIRIRARGEAIRHFKDQELSR